ncbi:hypothetical protein BDB00DRAFT_873904 [Zychaea mexicana]|uniref:uncharacterized protein n=1 Tax=Zychaea mexicana TaxID=64656 RepID=UPI0022FDC4AD|nr:uncharacterized protein BDB00DRAFT_873904 [Zychaea mexicana]KAI9491872.1 hypothetical protein BDB00DRAFT_873904 [Zychaea mexicana]
MVPSLGLPVLSLAVTNIHKLDEITDENISSMWSVFSKCKDNLENGRRLENLSWRLWFRESVMADGKGAREKTDTATTLTLSMTTAEHVRTPIPICPTSATITTTSSSLQQDEKTQHYFEPTSSAGSSMKDSAISGCGRSAKRLSVSSFKRMVSSLEYDHPVEEARRAYEEQSSASKPTAEAARLSKAAAAAADHAEPTKIREQDKAVAPVAVAHDLASQPRSKNSSKFYVKEKNVVSQMIGNHDENLLDDDGDEDDTCSEWSAQDDETVFADDDDENGDRSIAPTNSTNWEFQKQVPKNDDLPKTSLLSVMLKKYDQGSSSKQKLNESKNHHHYFQQQLAQGSQRAIARSSHTRPIHQHNHYNHRKPAVPVGISRAGRIHNAKTGNECSDLSESLQFCVDWERRQNVSPPIAILQQQHQRRLSACVSTSRATAICTTTTTINTTTTATALTSCFDSFRGW